MKLVATVLEETCEAAIEAIRGVTLPHDMLEVRAERFPSIDLAAIRAATSKPIILTYRNTGAVPPIMITRSSGAAAVPGRRDSLEIVGGRARPPLHGNARQALDAGIDFVDVEWPNRVDVPERTVFSHHDFDGMREVESIMAGMRAAGCAYTKLAATPRSFADNERLLRLLPGTVIGMGERGLYSRILAPFVGSELAFVAAGNVAAPGQLTLARALEIYGETAQKANRVFAVVGNPAGHSLSPVIHNRLFREKGVPAAYTIASIESFDEITAAFLRGNPCGLSVTTPFKEDALRIDAEVGENARRARAVNTLVNVRGRILADNTDVDGFAMLIAGSTAAGRTPHHSTRHTEAAVLGAGPTARAALVALEDAKIPAVSYNRANMHTLAKSGGDLIINTLPPEADVAIPRCRTYIEASYSGEPRQVDAETRFTGLDLLHAQAVRQHQLFMKVFDGL